MARAVISPRPAKHRICEIDVRVVLAVQERLNYMNTMNSEHLIRACESQISHLLKRTPAAPTAAVPIGSVLYDAADHCSSAAGAKRARPRLVAAFGSSVEAPSEGLVKVAVAGELIHAASLVHDDVIDEGTLRRGRPTVNAVWDNLTAVLTGDLMFSLAFRELSDSPSVVMNNAAEVLREMSCAAIDEASARGQMDLSLAAWTAIAEGKTGALFGWCGKSAAHLVGNDAVAEQFDICGRKLGIAFQLADDLKDLQAPGGKDRFQDIRNQNPSYPLLWAFSHDDTIRAAFEAAWTANELDDAQVETLGAMILNSDAIAATEAALRAEVAAAVEALGTYAETDGGAEILSWARALSANGAVVAFAERLADSRDPDAVPLARRKEGAA